MLVHFLQIEILPDPSAQRRRIKEATQEFQGKEGLLLLPEIFHAGYSALPGGAIGRDDPFITDLRTFSARNPNLPIFGSVALRRMGGKPTNTMLLFHSGDVFPLYEKIHRFSPMQEDTIMEAGAGLSAVNLPFPDGPWKIGVAICYDLRFPEMFRLLRDAGCDLILVSAQWPQGRIEAWKALLAARATENQCFVAGCNRCGSDGPTTFGGASALFGPSGSPLAALDANPGVCAASLDRGILGKTRGLFDPLADRRPDVYRLEAVNPVRFLELGGNRVKAVEPLSPL